MFKFIRRFLSKPCNLVLANAFLITMIVLGNIFMQAFCIPTTWAIIFISFCFLYTIYYPLLLRNKKIHILCGFMSCVTFCVFIYCVLFLEHINLIGLFAIFIFGIGFITYIPHFLAFQLLWLHLIKPVSKAARNSFLAGLAICVLMTLFVGKWYAAGMKEVERCKNTNYQSLEKTFMTEKILGMHFIYHTRICEYDGWRPPKHEPLLILGMWLINRQDPLNISLDERIALYKKFFPGNKIKFDCSCAVEYSANYHNDTIWKRHGIH